MADKPVPLPPTTAPGKPDGAVVRCTGLFLPTPVLVALSATPPSATLATQRRDRVDIPVGWGEERTPTWPTTDGCRWGSFVTPTYRSAPARPVATLAAPVFAH